MKSYAIIFVQLSVLFLVRMLFQLAKYKSQSGEAVTKKAEKIAGVIRCHDCISRVSGLDFSPEDGMSTDACSETASNALRSAQARASGSAGSDSMARLRVPAAEQWANGSGSRRISRNHRNGMRKFEGLQ